MSLPRVVFGTIPPTAEYRVPANQFIMFDNRLVHAETISAEQIISQPREIALYSRAFDEPAKLAVVGEPAYALVSSALDRRR